MAAPPWPVPQDADVAALVDRLDADRREAYEERAAIVEFDAGLPRVEAERRALVETLARYGTPASPSVRLLAVEIAGGTEWVLTSDAADARRTLAESGATSVVDVDLADVLDDQFGGLAYLTTGP